VAAALSFVQLGATNKSSADQLAGYFLVGFFMTLMPACQHNNNTADHRAEKQTRPLTPVPVPLCTAHFTLAASPLTLRPLCPVSPCPSTTADLYHSVFDMSVSENAPIYLIITLAAAAMLTLAYRNVEQGTFALSVTSERSTQTHAFARRDEKGQPAAAGC